jgi:uncharacterized repeat protein (TIGR01451 family)
MKTKKMTKLCRIMLMILVFFLLTSAVFSVLASQRGGETKEARRLRGEMPDLLRYSVSQGSASTGTVGMGPESAPPALFSSRQLTGSLPRSGVELDELPIEPELLRVLLEAESNGDGYVRAIVHLREQVDLDRVTGELLSTTETRLRLVSALQANAARSQAPLLAQLERAQAAGLVNSYAPFWIFNGIAVRAQPSYIYTLAAHPSVVVVRLDHWRQWLTEETPNPNLQTPNPNLQPPISNLQSPTSNLQSPTSNLYSLFSAEWGVSRIRADKVWASLGVSGTGVVVAGMDTGVDWLHPALQASYRAYNPHGPSNHTYSWHDATGGGALYPVDGRGHGSHTMGTIAGQDGIGIAPGARWIAVKVLNSAGYGLDSWIHEGFQWLLAPGGDPSLTPDVVNNSWGSKLGSLTTFQSDLQALRAAGIFAVFSCGNNGPGETTIQSPASLPGAFAVGATDSDDDVANFSSRGPSPWGEIRPHVVAPGVDVRSSLPGGAFGLKNGTSMAAPHVAGVVALLRSVSPTLSVTRTAFLITSTAVPLTVTFPNNDTGWGRVDAFAAVVALAHPGFITGTVIQAGGGQPVVGAVVEAVSYRGGGSGRTITGEDGSYLLALAPAVYDLAVSAFGYEPDEILGVPVTTGTSTLVDFSLAPLPTGTLRGHVADAITGESITATVSVLDTPAEATGDAFVFTLPAGTYTIRARGLGYRIVTATASISAGQVMTVDLALDPAPSILLIDSGRWYYGTQASYFRQALDDLAYAYDEWAIKHLPDDLPVSSDLAPYDVVVWSAPSDAPGYIGAQSAIVGYLSAGGKLLLSGQDVGLWDGGGVLGFWSAYYYDYLKAHFVNDNAPTRVLEGLGDDIFAGLTFTIAGSGGADNQDYPDEIAVADPDAAAPLLAYRNGRLGGMRVGTCLDYRVIYLSFGFEAVNDRAARREVMDRVLDWLVSPTPVAGLELKSSVPVQVGLPGSVVTHALRVRHVGQAGVTDTVHLSLAGVSWPTQLSATSIPLAPCTSATVLMTVTIPTTARWDAQDGITLTARSSVSHTLVETTVLTSKVVAPILLVDDGRWTSQAARYEAALARNGFSYDYWHTRRVSSESPGGSPSLDILQRYPVVVWFTAYDWFEPVTANEEAALAAYLDGGGRLFLSSQDFLYLHHDRPLSQGYLGVMGFTEAVTATLASGVPESLVGDRLGPYSLNYPFNNWSDAVVPIPGLAVSFREQEHRAIGLARQGEGYRTVFFSFPFEALPETARTETMERVVGWLSWLGGSTVTSDRSAVSSGDALTYTIVLRNDGSEIASTSLSNTLPLSLTLIPGSLTDPAQFYAPARRIAWEGALEPGATITFTYRVTVATGSSAGTPIVNKAQIGLEDQGIRFERTAVVRADAPDLSSSVLGCEPSPARPSGLVTCTVMVANTGPADAPRATLSGILVEQGTLVTGSLTLVGGGTAQVPTGTLRWNGPLRSGDQITLTYQLTLPTFLAYPYLYSVAFLEDGMEGAWERATWLPVEPLRAYLPLILKVGALSQKDR